MPIVDLALSLILLTDPQGQINTHHGFKVAFCFVSFSSLSPLYRTHRTMTPIESSPSESRPSMLDEDQKEKGPIDVGGQIDDCSPFRWNRGSCT